MNYEELRDMDWQEAVKKEKLCTIVRELGDGWWLFEKMYTGEPYNGILGWDYGYGDRRKYFAVHNPALTVKCNIERYGYRTDQDKVFTDGRQVKWITRSFLPPQAGDYAKSAIQQIGVLDQADIAYLERIHDKLAGLLRSGSDQHQAAMKMAKKNRETLRKKWFGSSKTQNLRPEQPPVPENVSATVNLLNGHTP